MKLSIFSEVAFSISQLLTQLATSFEQLRILSMTSPSPTFLTQESCLFPFYESRPRIWLPAVLFATPEAEAG